MFVAQTLHLLFQWEKGPSGISACQNLGFHHHIWPRAEGARACGGWQARAGCALNSVGESFVNSGELNSMGVGAVNPFENLVRIYCFRELVV
jgi:hypothetical protein